MNPNVPPRAALLLDFIAKGETGTSGPEGYGIIVFNNQKKLPKPLVEYTIDELLAAQKTWAKNWKGSAAGRYQIIRRTLLGLVSNLGIPGSTKFSPDVQDRLGYALLTQRGWQAYSSGQVTPGAFALALAKEWASMPVLSTVEGQHRIVRRGESYYAGDGVNASQKGADELEAILAAVRQPDADPAPSAAPSPSPAPSASPVAGRWSFIGWVIGLLVKLVAGLWKK